MTSLILVNIGSSNAFTPDSTKPLADPMLIYSQLNPHEQTPIRFELKYNLFLLKEFLWTFLPHNIVHTWTNIDLSLIWSHDIHQE